MVKLRPATIADWARLFAWRNDQMTRAMSRNTDEVTLAHHMMWLTAALKDRNRILMIATAPQHSLTVGTCSAHLDRINKRREVEISLAVDARYRGHGYAALMIDALCQHVIEVWKPTLIYARVREGNIASLRAFASVGFMPGSRALAASDMQEPGIVVLDRMGLGNGE